ncbi:KpsF/GutQ family sugar-phosphate isomerase [Celerinatantimonas sp. MCCC 1A17872]|uniref:KpsF/GutQ family sugar-phosphate isomerase n=1 Tax=Celerinatantimonas sp. MCCC 1A17872 TaxID=3177514 RepID=UPI0038CBFCFD
MVSFDYIKTAQRVINLEAQAVNELLSHLNEDFIAICRQLAQCQGKVIVTGMGKSGHIGRKIAATLASTGTPAFFVHPGEASHGDLGMISQGDLVFALSNSGESSEILALYPVLQHRQITIIAMTSNPGSSMARGANFHLNINVRREACPLGLAPTASTTAALVMGDAIAVTLLEERGFTANDFALSHPGGALGKKLLLSVPDIMLTGEEIPLVGVEQTIREALLEMSEKGLGMTGVIDSVGRLVGLFTDGDLRRILDLRADIHETAIGTVMTKDPYVIEADWLAFDALKFMKEKSINGLFVTDKQIPIGAFNMHSLLQAGVY